MLKSEILVIDDELPIRKLLEITLESSGYKTLFAKSGKEGILSIAHHPSDMVILDLGLPDEDGYSVLTKIRAWYTNPILILSVQNNEDAIVKALDNGANDYLTKPFRTQELLARIRVALRQKVCSDNISSVLTNNNLFIDIANRIVKKRDEIVKLTPTEFSLLVLFAKNEGKVLLHQQILKEIWGPRCTEQSQYLRVFIAQLRKKIETNPNRPEYIHTQSGIGYRFTFND